MNDLIVELDKELALIEQLPYRVPIHVLAKRARDEIVALRAERDETGRFVDRVKHLVAAARDEALDAAAAACRLLGKGGDLETALACAAAIRALK